MQQPEFELRQFDLLQNVRSEEIASGTRGEEFIDVLQLECPVGGIVLDLGCGTADIADLLPRRYAYIGIDINPDAVRQARLKSGPYGGRHAVFQGDVRSFYQPDAGIQLVRLIEQCDFVTALGLFPSLLREDDLGNVFRVAESYLRPRGLFAVADVLHAEDANPALWDALGGGLLYANWRQNWLSRYRVNRQVMPQLPDGTFGVARPSLEEKTRLDWLKDPVLVSWFLRSDVMLERFARHWRLGQIVDTASRCGFGIEAVTYHVWASRRDQPLSGVQFLFRRAAPVFRYHPWYTGMTFSQMRVASEMDDLTGAAGLSDPQVRAAFMETLRRRLPAEVSGSMPRGETT